jgi:hypothetical protein
VIYKALAAMFMLGGGFFAALPATSNYKLNSYGFGSGGGSQATSNYAVEGITGDASGLPASTITYTAKPGFVQAQQANVPKLSAFDNNGGTYSDKLHFVIDQQGNPSDAKYALQISTASDFSSGVNYVKSDNTIGATLTTGDYQTYSAWGGSSGANILGLSPTTTYYLRVKATQGKFTESAYGPSSSATTAAAASQTLSFCLYTGANCAAGGSAVSFSSLVPGTVASGSNTIKVDFDTNATGGGKVYIYSLNGGLKSVRAGNYIISLSSSQVNLDSASEGFGAQSSGTQSSGGPFSSVSPYNAGSNTVGKINTTAAEILSSAGTITGGLGTITLKLLPTTSTPAASDYADTITLIAAATF